MKRHSDMQKVLGWLLPQHSSRAMPDSGSVLPTSPRHQAAHAFVSATSPALIRMHWYQIDSMPGKMLDDAGDMLSCCLAVFLQSQQPATAVQVNKRIAFYIKEPQCRAKNCSHGCQSARCRLDWCGTAGEAAVGDELTREGCCTYLSSEQA